MRVSHNLNPVGTIMWHMTQALSGDELKGSNGTLVWDGLGTVQLRYDGAWMKQTSTVTHQLLRRLGTRTIPVEALAGVELVMPGGTEQPMIRLVLRAGADPLMAVAAEAIDRLFDPYRFYFSNKQWLLADYYAQEIRTSIALHQLGTGPAERFLVEPPAAADELKGFDGKARIEDGELSFDWTWTATKEKKAAGDPRRVPLADITGVAWLPMGDKQLGRMRISTAATPAERPESDKDPETLLLGALQQVPGLLFGAKLLAAVRPTRPGA